MIRQVRIHNKNFKLFLPFDKIDEIAKEMAAQINRAYAGKILVLVPVLTGAMRFAALLMQYIEIPYQLETIKVKSYTGMHSTGRAELIGELALKNPQCHVLFIEDIVDTGNTVDFLMFKSGAFGILNADIATFLFKPEVYAKKHTIRFIGKEIPATFVVGFGLDYNGEGRSLNHIYNAI